MDLTRALREVYGEAAAPERVDPLQQNASSRSYFRVHLPGRRPSTLVAMVLGADPTSPEEASAGAAPSELPFLHVGRFLAARGVPVPRVYAVDRDAGVILLEDLGDVTLETRLLGTDPAAWDAPYGDAIDALVAFQTATATPDVSCTAYDRGFDETLLRWELDHFREWGLEAPRAEPLPVAARRALDAELDALAKQVAAVPRRLVHRDFQSRNLLCTSAGIVLIDFQDALLGPAPYDLVALLCDSYVDVVPPLRDDLIRRYADAVGHSFDDVSSTFHLVAVQRKLKDAGRFVFIDRVKGNPSFLRYFPHSVALVRRSLAARPDLAALGELLDALLPEPPPAPGSAI